MTEKRASWRGAARSLAMLILFVCPWRDGRASGASCSLFPAPSPPRAGVFWRHPERCKRGLPLHGHGLASVAATAAMALRLRGGGVAAAAGDGGVGMLVQQAAQALHVLHDPQETQERRREALAMVEGIKKETADEVCMQTAGQLISTDFADPIRHFGFQLYDHLVMQRWEQLAPPVRDALKRDLLVIMASRTRPLLQEQKFVLEKLAQVVVGVARREWPQRWATLSGDLRTLATGGSDVQLYLTVLVWRGLAHEAAAADMPAAARAKLVINSQNSLV